MAINFGEVFNTLHDGIQTKVTELLRIAHLAKEAKVTVDEVGEFPFTVPQKKALNDKYNLLKTEIKTLLGKLP